MRSKTIFRVAVTTLGLVLGLIAVPLAATAAAANVTQQITVLGVDGSPYVGAQVAIGYSSVSEGMNQLLYTATATTNASGVVSVTHINDTIWGMVAVQPPVTDTTTASSATWGLDLNSGANLTINLTANSMRMEIVKPDDSAADPFSYVYTYANNQVGVIRAGSFGMTLPSDLPENECTQLRAENETTNSNLFYKDYSTKIIISAGKRVGHIYSDRTCTTEILPVNGVVKIKQVYGNVSGSIRNTDGTTASLTNLEGYSANILPTSSNGVEDSTRPSGIGVVVSNGNYFGYVDTSTAGRYDLMFNSSGSLTRPSFKAGSFWVTSGGQFSTSADSSSPASTYSQNFNIPTPNLKVRILHPTTGVASASSININLFKQPGRHLRSTSPNGLASAYLPNAYYFANANVFKPGNEEPFSSQYVVNVTGGSAAVTSLGGSTATLVDGVWELRAQDNNFALQISDSDGTGIGGGWFNYCKIDASGNSSSCGGRGVSTSGQGATFLSIGNWAVTVNPGSSTLVAKTYSVTVTSETITVTGATKTGNYWILKAATPNISGALKDSSSNNLTFTGDQGISLNLQKYVNNRWEWQNNGSYKQSVQWGVNIASAGIYRMVASPNGYPDLAQTYSQEFCVDNSIQVKVIAEGRSATEPPTCPAGGGYSDTLTVNILMKSPNLKFKVTNPIDSSLMPGGWVEIQKIRDDGGSEWVGNADINQSTPGLTSTYLPDLGEYILRVNPPQGSESIVGLATKEYRAIVTALDSVTVTSGGVAVAKDGARFIVSPGKANVTAKVVYANGAAFGNTNGKWLNANLQKWQESKGYWEWGPWANANQDGYISLTVNTAGKYRLRLQPQGDPDVTVTYSEEFVITSESATTFEKNFGNIALLGPSIKIAVKTSSSDRLNYTNIEIRKNGQWIDWANTQNNGVAAISLPSEGQYEFTVHPNSDIASTASRKTYEITATKSLEGVITAVADSATGVSVASDVTTLLLGSPTISGTVRNPGDTAVVPNSQVFALDLATNREMWEFSANSNQNGAWAMSLPKGNYKIMARAPWGVADFGNSAYSEIVSVDESGNAASLPAGITSTTFKILLQSPTWSGTVRTPDGSAAIANAGVCLRLNQIWNCTNATSSGAWALSAPTGYTGNFSTWVTDAFLEARDDMGRQYTNYRADGKDAVQAKLGNSGANIALTLTSPNTRITVTAGGLPAANIWVNAERDNVGWLGGASTNAEGVASLNIPDTSTAFTIRADVGGNPLVGANYSSTQKRYEPSDISAATVSSVFTKTLPLDTPNFRVVVREPRADGSVGPIVAGTWVDMFNESSGQWMGGSSTNTNGVASFNVAKATGCYDLIYTLNVNPPWGTSTNYSRQSYKLLINCNGDITLSNKLTDAVITKESIASVDVYSITLGIPSITGVVVSPTSVPVANSWVVPVNTTTYEWMWQIGSSSRSDGTFGIGAPSGNYRIEANIPWGLSNVAKPAPCNVTVLNGAVTTTTGGCVQADKSVVLALRAPNVTFTLKSGGNAVANANVSLAAGKWFTNAQTNNEGKISFFIDADEIRTLNATSASTPLNIWVDPPYGSSTMARWDCQAGDTSKPICADLVAIPATGSYPEKLLGDITGVQPNTKIRVVYPDATAATGAWVNIFTIKPSEAGYGKRWLAAGGSDSEGYVAFNIDTATVTSAGATYVVEVSSPWNKRALFSSKEHTNSGAGYAWVGINNQSFGLATPNLKITVYAPNGTDRSKFGWLGVQEVDNSGNYLNWVGGYGLDDSAATSIYLAESKRFRIFANPGPGRPGTQTDCIVQTNDSAVVSLVSGQCGTGTFSGTDTVRISLNGGNVVGRVVRASGGANVSGAIVFANYVGAPDESTAVISCTSDEGLYGLELDKTKTWNIKIIPVAKEGQTDLASQTVSNVQPLTSGTRTLTTIQLANK